MQMDDLLAALGAEVVDYPVKAHCCGGHMTQISEPQAFELIRRLLQSAADYNADMILCMCPMCQLNLDGYQGRVNGHFGTNFKLPIMYFTQMLGLAFGLDPRSSASARSSCRRAWPVSKIKVQGQAAGGQRYDPARLQEGRSVTPHAGTAPLRGTEDAGHEPRAADPESHSRESAFTSATAAATSPARSTWRGRPAGPARTARNVVGLEGLQVHVLVAGPADDRGRHQGRARPAWSWQPARRTCTKRPSAAPASGAGLNPYLCQMTNIREHVSWVNSDKAAGTEKAKALVSAAAERVKHQQPLEPMTVKVNPATLVVGGGIAGLQATLELADAGYQVYLVEREPSIGGHMAQFDKTFPTLDCSACILTPKMSEVGQHENVTMLTYSELEEVERLGGQLQGEDPQEGPLRRRRQVHRLRHLHREVPAQGARRRVRGRHGLSQGDLHARSRRPCRGLR